MNNKKSVVEIHIKLVEKIKIVFVIWIDEIVIYGADILRVALLRWWIVMCIDKESQNLVARKWSNMVLESQ